MNLEDMSMEQDNYNENENNEFMENSYEITETEQIPLSRVNEQDKGICEKFLCIICHTILINPVKCKLCKYHFCNICITQWLKVKNKCPHCLGVTRFEESEYYLRMDLSDLLIDCKYKEEGCAEYRRLKQISEHVSKCGYMQQNCEFCDTKIFIKDINEHLKYCNKNADSWKMYEYYTEKINKIEKDYQKEYCRLTNEFKTWIKRKEFKMKQLMAFDDIQKNILNQLNKININK